MFSKEFIAQKRQKRQEARARVLEHIELMVKALGHGQHEALGVWDLGDGVKVSVEILGDGTLRARRWTKDGVGNNVDETLPMDEYTMNALRSEPEPVEW